MTGLQNVLAYLVRVLTPHLPSIGSPVHAEQTRLLKRSASGHDRVESAEVAGEPDRPAQTVITPESAVEEAGPLCARAAASERRVAALEAEVEQLRQAAVRYERAKDDFLGTLSHELRTPLNATLGWIQLLRLQVDQPEQRTYALDVIERNARKQEHIIRDLLDVSRMIAGHVDLERAPVNVEEAVQKALEEVRELANAKAIAVQFESQGPATVNADPVRLHQIVWNLLSNAIKFTAGGGQVDVRVKCEGTEAAIEVRDSGIGILPALLPHVFDRFRQGDGSLTRAFGGLGLGLAIVRHLVELHGGTVQAESAGLGRGATFVVRLPLLASAAGEPGVTQPADR